MRYAKIYALLQARKQKVPEVSISDHSGWRGSGQSWSYKNRPLWLIVEDPGIDRRIWISHEFREYSISTAQLSLHIDSQEYHKSYRRRKCRNQLDLAVCLEQLFSTGEIGVQEERAYAG